MPWWGWVLIVTAWLAVTFMALACCRMAAAADEWAEEMRRRLLAEALLRRAEDGDSCQDAQEAEDEQNYQRMVGEGLGLIG